MIGMPTRSGWRFASCRNAAQDKRAGDFRVSLFDVCMMTCNCAVAERWQWLLDFFFFLKLKAFSFALLHGRKYCHIFGLSEKQPKAREKKSPFFV